MRCSTDMESAGEIGMGDWRVRHEHLIVVYNWPDDTDATTARVVTLWRES